MAASLQNDGNESEGDSSLRQDLTCPVCRGIFQDPVLLPCSHSFCRECERRSRQRSNKCPVCRAELLRDPAVSNRALRDACESFQRQASWGCTRSAVGVCKLHMEPLELYCEKDEEPMCVGCVSLHSSHNLLPLSGGAQLCKVQLTCFTQSSMLSREKYLIIVCLLTSGRELID